MAAPQWSALEEYEDDPFARQAAPQAPRAPAVQWEVVEEVADPFPAKPTASIGPAGPYPARPEQPETSPGFVGPPRETAQVQPTQKPSLLARAGGAIKKAVGRTARIAFETAGKSELLRAQGQMEMTQQQKVSVQRGLLMLGQAKDLYDISLGGDEKKQFAAIAEGERQLRGLPPSQAVVDFMQADGPDEAIRIFLENPVEIVGSVSLEALAQFAPGFPVMAGMGAVAGPLGAAAGAGSSSFLIEYSGKFFESLREAGVDLADPDAIARAFGNKKLMADAKAKARKKGLIVGAFDALTMGFAGKIYHALGAGRGPVARAGATGLEGLMQAAGGGGGEAASQIAESGRVTSYPEVALEFVAEVGMAVPETAIGAYTRQSEGEAIAQRRTQMENLKQRMALDSLRPGEPTVAAPPGVEIPGPVAPESAAPGPAPAPVDPEGPPPAPESPEAAAGAPGAPGGIELGSPDLAVLGDYLQGLSPEQLQANATAVGVEVAPDASREDLIASILDRARENLGGQAPPAAQAAPAPVAAAPEPQAPPAAAPAPVPDPARADDYGSAPVPEKPANVFPPREVPKGELPQLPDREDGSPTPVVWGDETTIDLPNGEQVRARYAFVEHEDVQASHLPLESFAPNPRYRPSAQEKDYQAETALRDKILGYGRDFKPQHIYSTDPTPIGGPPIVDPNLITMGGNARTQAAGVAESRETGRLALDAAGGGFGVSPLQLEGMARPFPVRVLLEGIPQSPKEDLALSRKLNQTQTSAPAPRAAGRSYAALLSEQTVGLIETLGAAAEDAATVRSVLSRSKELPKALQRDGIITKDDANQFIDKDGLLTARGKLLVDEILLGVAVPDKDVSASMKPALAERMLSVAIAILRAETAYPGILSPLTEAAARSEVARAASDMTLDDFLRQTDLFATAPSQLDPTVAAVQRWLAPVAKGGASAPEARATFSGYASRLVAIKNEQADLTGPMTFERAFTETLAVTPQSFRAKQPWPDPAVVPPRPTAQPAPEVPAPTVPPPTAEELGGSGLAPQVGEEVTFNGGTYIRPKQMAGKVVELREDGDLVVEVPYSGKKKGSYRKRIGRDDLIVGKPKGGVSLSVQPTEQVQKQAGPNYVPLRKIMPSREPWLRLPRWRGVLRRGRILEDLAKTEKISINQGRLRLYAKRLGEGVLGYYFHGGQRHTRNLWEPGRRTLRIKRWGDVEVAAHEFFHSLSDKYRQTQLMVNGRNESGAAPNAQVLELHYISYDVMSVEEGLAEFGRLWLTNRDALAARAPLSLELWESEVLPTLPRKLRKGLAKAQKNMHDWFGMGFERIYESKIGPSGGDPSDAVHNVGNRIRQAMIDDLHAFAADERIVNDGILPDGVFEFSSRLRGISGIVSGFLELGVPVLERDSRGNWQIAGYSGKGLLEMLQPVSGSRRLQNRFFRYADMRMADEMMEQGRERLWTREEIDDGLALADRYLDSDGNKIYEQVFDELVKFNGLVADFGQAAGLFSAQQRSQWMRLQYAMSLARDMTRGDRGILSSPADPLASTSNVYRLRGSTRQLRHPMDRLIEGPAKMIQLGLENLARQKVAHMFMQPGGGVLGQPISVEKSYHHLTMKELDKGFRKLFERIGMPYPEGEIKIPDFIQAVIVSFDKKPFGPDVMTVLRDGRPYYYQVFDPLTQQALRAFRRPPLSMIEKSWNQLRRMKQAAIVLFPPWMLKNVVRDTIQASINTRTGMQSITSAAKGLLGVIREDADYQLFMANGGMGGTMHYIAPMVPGLDNSRAARGARALRRTIVKHAQRRNMDPRGVIFTAGDVLRFLESVGQKAELINRLGEFKRARKQGASVGHATYLGREVSTDFARQGDEAAVRFLMHITPFLNAMVAGTDRTYRALPLHLDRGGRVPILRSRDNSDRMHIGEMAQQGDYNAAGRWLVAAGLKTASMALISVGLHALIRDYDEFKEIPEHVRRGYWPIPDFDEEDGRLKITGFYKIPRIWETGAIAHIAELAYDLVMGGNDEEDKEIWRNMALTVIHNFGVSWPVGIQEGLEWTMNQDFYTGSPTESARMEALVEARRYRMTDPELLKEFGRAQLDNDFQVSPAKVDQLMRSLFGHFYTLGVEQASKWIDPDAYVAMHDDDQPFVRDYYMRAGKYSDIPEEFYSTMREINQEYMTARRENEEEGGSAGMDYLERHPLGQLGGSFQRRSILEASRYNKLIREASVDPELSPEERRDQRDELLRERNDFMKKSLEIANRELERIESP